MKQSSFVGEQARFLRGKIELEKQDTVQHMRAHWHCMHSPPTVLQGLMVLENEFLEAEVSLEGNVVLQVGQGEYIPVQYEGLAGHELHEPLAEVPHQPLL